MGRTCINCGCDAFNDPNYPHSVLVAENERLRQVLDEICKANGCDAYTSCPACLALGHT